jgi:hypothetical protein
MHQGPTGKKKKKRNQEEKLEAKNNDLKKSRFVK